MQVILIGEASYILMVHSFILSEKKHQAAG
jgi:hypothetical protein